MGQKAHFRKKKLVSIPFLQRMRCSFDRIIQEQWCIFMSWNQFLLDLSTLPFQNLASPSPIGTKWKMVFKLTKSLKVYYVLKVLPLVHTEKWNTIAQNQ